MFTTGGHPNFVSNFNCVGAMPEDIDTHLKTWLSCFNMAMVTNSPTRMQSDGKESMLDLIIEPEHTCRLSKQIMVMIVYSDNRLVKAHLDCARPHLTRVTHTFGNYKNGYTVICHLQSELRVDAISVG